MDAVQTEQIVEYMAENAGPMYLRINRNNLPVFTDPAEKFVPGKVYTIREGKDAVVFSTGVMVSKAMEAADMLTKEGIDVRVVNVPSIKPIDKEAVVKISSEVTGVVTAEEHSVMGGLGSVICEAIAPSLAKKVQFVGIQDSFGTSAENYDVLLEYYGLTAQAVADAVKESLK